MKQLSGYKAECKPNKQEDRQGRDKQMDQWRSTWILRLLLRLSLSGNAEHAELHHEEHAGLHHEEQFGQEHGEQKRTEADD